MSRTVTVTRALPVTVLDAEGEDTDRRVTVYLDVAETTYVYGEDADGRRGQLRTEETVLQAFVDLHDAATLTDRQIQQLKDDATRIFYERGGHF